jgi:hypothetical protein
MPLSVGDYRCHVHILGVGVFEFRPVSSEEPFAGIALEVLLKEIAKTVLYLQACANDVANLRNQELGGSIDV